MGEQFEGAGKEQRLTEASVDLTKKLQDESSGLSIGNLSEISRKFKSDSDSLLETVVENSALARYGLVTVEGLAYTVPGVLNGIYHNVTHLPELGLKVGMAATIGIGLRLLLPEKGAARALVGTTMGAFFIKDALHPIVEAYKKAGDARNIDEVHSAAKGMGDGLGLFVVDSAIGIKVGKFAEGMTGRALRGTLGTKDYLRFEQSKEIFWNSDKHFHGRALNWVATKADKATGALAARLISRRQKPELPIEEQLRLVNEAGKEAHRNINDGGFYRFGPKDTQGQRLGYSEYLDRLMAGEKLEAVEVAKPMDLKLSLTRPASGEAAPKGIAPKDAILGEGPLGAAEVKPGAGAPPPELRPVTGDVVAEFDPANLAKLAAHAQRVQKSWTSEAIQIADYREHFQSPVFAVSDASRRGAMLRPEYDPSMKQIVSLASQVQNEAHLREAGFVLDLHAKSAIQDQLRLPNTIDLNNFAAELHGIFVSGLRKQNISDGVLAGKVPARTAVTNDQGAGNFVIPNIDGVIDRAVTVYPRSQTGLMGVFPPIQRHELLGHAHTYGDLARFPKEFRESLVADAVKAAMTQNKIADVDVSLPGLGTIKKSELFKRMLIAEANENTADIMGAATGGSDSAISLGVLLQSLRKGGLLETRKPVGKDFAEFIEPHGFDRWRIKLQAEVMRQLSNGDKDVINVANALDNYAARASRPGSDYVLVAADQPGQHVSIPMKEWDAVIPHIVRAQLDTRLESLEGNTFRSILPDLPSIVRKIDTLAAHMTDSVKGGRDTLAVPFDKTEFSVGQVFSAGLRAWQMAVARGEDPGRALSVINKISAGLRAEYRESNPHIVPVQPVTGPTVRTAPIKAAADFTGRMIARQPDLRNASARYATHMGSAATYLLMEDVLHYHRMKKELEARAAQ